MTTNSAEERFEAALGPHTTTPLDAIDASPNVILFPPRAPLAPGIGDEMSAGIETGQWFEELVPDDSDFDTTPSIRTVEGATQTAITAAKHQHILGGTYDEAQALTLINGIYFVGTSNHEVGIFRLNEAGIATFVPDKEFKLRLANVRVRTGKDGTGLIPAEKFWLAHPDRRQLEIVFRPGGTANATEYNLWRGFAVEARRGWAKQRRLLRHILKVICRRDKKKFKYLMRWLAWAVQHPDGAPGTIIVLMSSTQGTGKSTLGVVICRIFGEHGRRLDDHAQLLGQFNAEMETTCFILAEEMFFAGDPKIADKLKSRITSEVIPLEAKYRNRREVPNRMHVMMTTNHEHAVPAGVRDRRFCVLDVSDEHAQDAAWFGPLYRDLENGGTEQFLGLLQNLKLGAWHPRELVKTDEAVEQQRMSGDSVAQWSRACIDADAIVGTPGGITHDIGRDIPTETLAAAYAGYCRQQVLRPANSHVLGKALAGMFGQRKRLPKAPGGRRPWGYLVPDEDQWQAQLDARLGIGRK